MERHEGAWQLRVRLWPRPRCLVPAHNQSLYTGTSYPTSSSHESMRVSWMLISCIIFPPGGLRLPSDASNFCYLCFSQETESLKAGLEKHRCLILQAVQHPECLLYLHKYQVPVGFHWHFIVFISNRISWGDVPNSSPRRTWSGVRLDESVVRAMREKYITIPLWILPGAVCELPRGTTLSHEKWCEYQALLLYVGSLSSLGDTSKLQGDLHNGRRRKIAGWSIHDSYWTISDGVSQRTYIGVDRPEYQ